MPLSLTACRLHAPSDSGVPDASERSEILLALRYFDSDQDRLAVYRVQPSGAVQPGPEIPLVNCRLNTRQRCLTSAHPTTGDLYLARPGAPKQGSPWVLERHDPATGKSLRATLDLGQFIPSVAHAHGPRCFLADGNAIYVADFRAAAPTLTRVYGFEKGPGDVDFFVASGRSVMAVDDEHGKLYELSIDSDGGTEFEKRREMGGVEGESPVDGILAGGRLVIQEKHYWRDGGSRVLALKQTRWWGLVMTEAQVGLWDDGARNSLPGEMGGGSQGGMGVAAGRIHACAAAGGLASVPIAFNGESPAQTTNIGGFCLDVVAASDRVIALTKPAGEGSPQRSLVVLRATAEGLERIGTHSVSPHAWSFRR